MVGVSDLRLTSESSRNCCGNVFLLSCFDRGGGTRVGVDITHYCCTS